MRYNRGHNIGVQAFKWATIKHTKRDADIGAASCIGRRCWDCATAVVGLAQHIRWIGGLGYTISGGVSPAQCQKTVKR